jgi:electron transfer flavoprotein alpha subunit
MRRIGIVIEGKDGSVTRNTLGAVTAGRGDDHHLFALVLDGGADRYCRKLASWGIHTIVDITFQDRDTDYDPDLFARAVAAAVAHFELDTLVGLTSATGREVLPRTAALLDAPLVMDCLEIRPSDNTARKPLYSGKTVGTVRLTGSPVIFGLRPNVVRPWPGSVEAETVSFSVRADSNDRLRVKQILEPQKGAADLSEAEIIISGGRGMGGGENYRILEDCARALGGCVGASRVAVDSGWVPHTMQVGQTGSTVNPKLYIACGISGAVQHLAGMKTSGLIVAINTDPEAPMVKISDYAVIGDLFEIVPLLTRALKRSAEPVSG